ncbi:MAG: glycosyltransferase family 4 protein [Rhodobacteraceae bacterium]|nr:glycosyltransferase family 4 protein [Paracoccaceae bacterium]
MHIAILTRQIGHYHDARYRGAAAVIEQVTVVSTTSQGGFAGFLAKENEGYGVRRLYGDRASYDAALAGGRLRAALWQMLDDIAPDVLAVAGWSSAESAAGILWAKQAGVPLVMLSESQADDAGRSGLRELVKKRIVAQCGAALVGGPRHAGYIAQLGMAKGKIALGYNAVDNAHFEAGAAVARRSAVEMRAKLGLPEEYLLASARFIAKKNLPALVRAYASVIGSAQGGPDLVILGDGDDRGQIEAAIGQTGMEARVRLPGFRGYDDLPAYYGLACGFAHVSTVEQWGLVINEAMAAGLPIIASEPCGATRTVIKDGESGIVTGTDEAALVAGLRRFSEQTAQERSKMGRAAARAISRWGPARFGAGLAEAAHMAQGAGPGRLLPWDRAVLARMCRANIALVS